MTTSGDPVEWVQVTRYLAGELSPDEHAAVEQWAAASPENRQLIDDARRIWAVGTDASASFDRVDAKRRLHERMGIASRPAVFKLSAKPSARRSLLRIPSWAYALACAVIVGIVLIAHQQASVGSSHYRTDVGKRQRITLADGTRIWLAPASQLRLAPGYGQTNRDVYLDGEAFFSVTHNVLHPFAVHAGSVVARDVGTEFDVRAYGSDGSLRVSVVEGEVAIGDVHARAGDVAAIWHDTLSLQHDVPVARLAAWTQGELVFQNTPIREAMTELGRWYGLDVQLADTSLAHGTLTASFVDEPLSDVLRSVAGALGAQVKQQGTTVTFSPLSKRIAHARTGHGV